MSKTVVSDSSISGSRSTVSIIKTDQSASSETLSTDEPTKKKSTSTETKKIVPLTSSNVWDKICTPEFISRKLKGYSLKKKEDILGLPPAFDTHIRYYKLVTLDGHKTKSFKPGGFLKSVKSNYLVLGSRPGRCQLDKGDILWKVWFDYSLIYIRRNPDLKKNLDLEMSKETIEEQKLKIIEMEKYIKMVVEKYNKLYEKYKEMRIKQ